MPRPHYAVATPTSPPRVMVIAEIGVNHDGRVERAVELVHAARATGADAVKLQLFQPDRLLSNQAMLARYQEGRAEDADELLAGLTLSIDEMRRVRHAARGAGLAFIATPFSPQDVDDLARLEVDAVKIASPDAVNPPLYGRAAGLGVPMFVSTGTCDLDELRPVAALLRSHPQGGCLLQCVSSYPTADHDASLHGLAAMKEAFAVPVGYSDHTRGIAAGGLAVAAGAVVVEKHLTYDRTAPGPDHAASLEPDQFAEYVTAVRQAAAMLGPLGKRVLDVERDVRKVSRQSVCATRDLAGGHTLTAGDLTVKRPGTGIPAAELASTVGRALARAVRAGDLLTPRDLA